MTKTDVFIALRCMADACADHFHALGQKAPLTELDKELIKNVYFSLPLAARTTFDSEREKELEP